MPTDVRKYEKDKRIEYISSQFYIPVQTENVHETFVSQYNLLLPVKVLSRMGDTARRFDKNVS